MVSYLRNWFNIGRGFASSKLWCGEKNTGVIIGWRCRQFKMVSRTWKGVACGTWRKKPPSFPASLAPDAAIVIVGNIREIVTFFVTGRITKFPIPEGCPARSGKFCLGFVPARTRATATWYSKRSPGVTTENIITACWETWRKAKANFTLVSVRSCNVLP